MGYGGVSLVRRACGLSRKAIAKGIHEIEAGVAWEGRIRRPGAGRKPILLCLTSAALVPIRSVRGHR